MSQKVIILRGPAGVGKSTISRIIQKKLGVNWTVIDVDQFKHYMPLKDGQSNRAERSKIAHDVSNFFALEMYKKNYGVILEEMYKKPFNDLLVDFLKANNVPFLKVFLYAPLEVVQQRSASRTKNPPSNEIERHFNEIEPYPDDLVIDTTQNSSEPVASIIIEALQRTNGEV